jgi:hypothetical protein
MTAEIGNELLPIMAELAHVARDSLIPALRETFDLIKQVPWGEITGALTQTFNPMNAFVAKTKEMAEADRLAGEAIVANMAGVRDAYGETATAITEEVPAVEKATHDFYQPMYGEAAAARRKAVAEVRALPGDLSQALLDGENDVRSGMTALTDLMENELSDAAQVAYLKGVLASQELAAGLNDERASVRGAAMDVKNDALEQLNLIESGAADAAVNAGTTFAEQVRLKAVDAGLAAAEVKRAVTGALEFEDEAGPIADTGVDSYTKGITDNWTAAQTAAISIRNAVKGGLAFDSWPGGYSIGSTWVNAMIAAMKAKQSAFLGEAYWYKNIYGGSLPTEGPLQHPDTGGTSIAESWLGGMVGALKDGRGEVMGALPSLMATGGTTGLDLAGAASGRILGGPGPTINITVEGSVLGDMDEFADRLAYRMRLAGA